ncbi:MAG: hypothetical protein AAGA68_08295 [Pseudomonadota bacterium]
MSVGWPSTPFGALGALRALFSLILGLSLWSADALADSTCQDLLTRTEPAGLVRVLPILENRCATPFTQAEQLFVAGAGGWWLRTCAFPAHHTSRARLLTFFSSSAIVAAVGRRYALPGTAADTAYASTSAAPYSAGSRAAAAIGCSARGKRIAEGIDAWLLLGARGSDGDFVRGCVSFFGGRHSEEDCTCLADIGASVLPNLHASHFTRDSVQRITRTNPLLGLQIALKCGLAEP